MTLTAVRDARFLDEEIAPVRGAAGTWRRFERGKELALSISLQ